MFIERYIIECIRMGNNIVYSVYSFRKSFKLRAQSSQCNTKFYTDNLIKYDDDTYPYRIETLYGLWTATSKLVTSRNAATCLRHQFVRNKKITQIFLKVEVVVHLPASAISKYFTFMMCLFVVCSEVILEPLPLYLLCWRQYQK